MLLVVHVALSLIGIAAGFVVIGGLLSGRPLNGWTALFLATTLATSLTGFLFPFNGVTPGIVIGVISVVILAVTIFARYARQMAGGWRPIYVVTAVIAQYLNFFVLIVQSFLKIPALKELAPTQSEAPFAIAQLVALVGFLLLGVLATIKFREQPRQASEECCRIRHAAKSYECASRQRARTCAGLAVPVVPNCCTVIEATRLPSAAASVASAPASKAQTIPAVALSPAPTTSIGPLTG